MPQTNSPLILTLDIGSSSTRGILFDANAQIIPTCIAQRPNTAHTTADGGADYDATDLLDGVVEVIDQILQSAGPLAQQIGAVAMDTFVGNILGVDVENKPVTAVYTYADTRNAAAAQAFREELGPDKLRAAHDRTGCLMHTSYLPARFRWLAENESDLFQSVRRWVSIGEFIYHTFFGEWAVSYSVASWSGMLNRRDLSWDVEWLDRLPVSLEQLSPLTDLDQPFQNLQGAWADRWTALASIPWLPAIGDGAAANIGSGCDRPDRIALTIGTTGAMRVVVDPGIGNVPDGLWLYRVDAQRGLLGGATTEGGNVFAWLSDILRLPAASELEGALAAQEPGGHGLTVLPFIGGERAPGWREDARAMIAGLNMHTEPVDILQASLEAIAYRFALIYRRIEPCLDETVGTEIEPEIIGSGGGLFSSPAWMQIFADVLNHPLQTLAETETTSRGLALLALEQLGVIDEPSDLAPATGKVYEPDPARHARYRKLVEQQEDLYRRVLG